MAEDSGKSSGGRGKPCGGGGCKNPKHSFAKGSSQASQCEKKTQSTGECVGRECGQLMRMLVLQLEEATLPVPQLSAQATEQQKMIWGEDCDMHLKMKDCPKNEANHAIPVSFQSTQSPAVATFV